MGGGKSSSSPIKRGHVKKHAEGSRGVTYRKNGFALMGGDGGIGYNQGSMLFWMVTIKC